MLTLSSDILAELDLPPSGIQDVPLVDYPKAVVEQNDWGHVENAEEKMMYYYSFQIHIRKTLNDIQKNLHPPESRSLLVPMV